MNTTVGDQPLALVQAQPSPSPAGKRHVSAIFFFHSTQLHDSEPS